MIKTCLKRGYSPDRKFKRCRGPLHPQGVMLPVSAFRMNNGRHEPRCRRCKALYYGRDSQNILISVEHFEPIVDFLQFHLGSKRAICDRLGVSRSYLSMKTEHRQGKHFRTMCNMALEIVADKGMTYKRVDRQVVEAEPLGGILREWQADFKKEWGIAERDTKTGNDSITFAPVSYLKEKTGIGFKKLSQILNSERPLVWFSDADRLASAIHRPELIIFGEIPVLHNPEWVPTQHIKNLKAQGLI